MGWVLAYQLHLHLVIGYKSWWGRWMPCASPKCRSPMWNKLGESRLKGNDSQRQLHIIMKIVIKLMILLRCDAEWGGNITLMQKAWSKTGLKGHCLDKVGGVLQEFDRMCFLLSCNTINSKTWYLSTIYNCTRWGSGKLPSWSTEVSAIQRTWYTIIKTC